MNIMPSDAAVSSKFFDKIIHCIASNVFQVAQDPDDYVQWLKHHHNALTDFRGMIMDKAKGKQIVVFLDRSLISDSDVMPSVVRKVAEKFSTVIIRGRTEQGYEYVDIGRPSQSDSGGSSNPEGQNGGELLPKFKEIFNELKVTAPKGVCVEDKGFWVSAGYSHASQPDYENLEKTVKLLTKKYRGFEHRNIKKVLEVGPSIKWSKGAGVQSLLTSLDFADSTNVFPIYIGDDKTDEDAFKVLRSSNQGCPILVSKTTPKEKTEALGSLRDPFEVLSFLILLSWLGGPMRR